MHKTENQRTIGQLNQWLEVLEKEADANPDPHEGRVGFEIKRAILYSRAFLLDEAEEAWGEATYLAIESKKQSLKDLVAWVQQEYLENRRVAIDE